MPVDIYVVGNSMFYLMPIMLICDNSPLAANVSSPATFFGWTSWIKPARLGDFDLSLFSSYMADKPTIISISVSEYRWFV